MSLKIQFLPIFISISLLFVFDFVCGRSNHNEIVQPLPGINFELNFRHYSGFLQVSSTHYLHYWFVTSQGDPTKDPLIFWFNGGPGCSSMEGLIGEMGPFLVNPDGHSLRRNPYSWNKYASIVYIESPAGVGFSYATDGNVTTDDDQTAAENYEAMKQFFGQHLEFRQQPVFITGESYAGVYVPMLTASIVKGQAKYPINLKGMMIGNGYMDARLNVETGVKFAYGHGLIDEITWNRLEQKCCHGCVDNCELTKLNGSCDDIIWEVNQQIWHAGLNPYDLYRDCDTSRGKRTTKMWATMNGLLSAKTIQRFVGISNNIVMEKKKKDYAPCMNDTAMRVYMNMNQTRKVLQIPSFLDEWDTCNMNVVKQYHKIRTDMSPYVMTVLNANVRTLLYYGDTDMACNFLLGQQFSARLGLPIDQNKVPWHFIGQIAGFKTSYSNGLFTFMTVRGTGHMVPEWRAPQSAYFVSQFLRNEEI